MRLYIICIFCIILTVFAALLVYWGKKYSLSLIGMILIAIAVATILGDKESMVIPVEPDESVLSIVKDKWKDKNINER